jgi:hypothetical protein
MTIEQRQSDPPLLRGFAAIQHASQHPGMPLMRLAAFAFKPSAISLETAYWLAQREKADEVYVYAAPYA